VNETKSVLPGDAGTQLLESEANRVGEIIGESGDKMGRLLKCFIFHPPLFFPLG